jgi:betaine-aldehyde dehydrogenase
MTVRVHGHHIAGKRVDGPLFDRHEPAFGRLVARYAEGVADDVDAAARTADATFFSAAWQRLTAPGRARLLDRFAALLTDHRDRLATIDAEEVGKPLRFAEGDIDLAIGHVEQAAALARTERGESYTGLAQSYVAIATREPVGVAGLIVPWNFPALILCQKLPYALAAGCTVVVKPSEFTSGSALAIAELVEEAGFPAGAVNVVTGLGPSVGAAIVTHPLVSFVSFTGSTATGSRIMAAAAPLLKRVSLELGGKNANVVLDDADLAAVAESVVFGAFANQGESCVAGSRLIVSRPLADDLVAEVVAQAGRLTVGGPMDPATDVGPLIHDAHRERVDDLVARGVQGGASAVLGGHASSAPAHRQGSFYLPTVLTGVDATSPVFQEEIFGPVLSVTTFDEADDAVRLANDTRYGLALSLWTRDVDAAFAISRRLRAGTVWVNTTSDGSPALAFGGTKQSGFGREAGAEGLREFTEYKTVQFRGEKRPSPFAR